MSNIQTMTFGRVIEANERHRPNHVALIHGDRSVTFGEFASRSRQLASALNLAGVSHQDRMAVLSMNSIEQCEIYGAAELAGYVAVGVNFRLIGKEIAYQLKDCAARVLLFQARYTDIVDSMREQLDSVVRYICIGEDTPDWADEYEAFLATGAPEGVPFRAQEEDIAYLVYTSGTTGRPKGCMLGHRSQLFTIRGCSAALGINRTDRVLVVMPLFHVGGKVVLLSAHWQGATCVLLDQFEPENYLQTMQDQRITVGHLAPPMILSLLDSPLAGKLDFSALRVILYSAASMPNEVLRKAMKVFGQVFQQQYGLTESAGLSLHRLEHDPDGDDIVQKRMRSIGIPFAGVELRIADDDGNPLPTGEPGEILLKSPGNMIGYWNDSGASIAALKGGWLRTGDVGKLDEDGYCYLVDRKKDMIVSGGENIYSREVEEVLFAHPAILEASVIGVPDEKWGESVRAVVVVREGQSLTEDDIFAHCREMLASYKKPRSVIFIDELPRLANGKFDKVTIRKQYSS